MTRTNAPPKAFHIKTPDGDAGQHADRPMKIMAGLIRRGRFPEEVMTIKSTHAGKRYRRGKFSRAVQVLHQTVTFDSALTGSKVSASHTNFATLLQEFSLCPYAGRILRSWRNLDMENFR